MQLKNFKSTANRAMILAGALFLLFSQSALALHPEEKSEHGNLKARIQQLEAVADEHDHATDHAAGGIGDHISLSGLIEVEASYFEVEDDNSESDLTLATVELSIEGNVNDQIGGHVTLLYDDDELDVDEAVISLTCGRRVAGVETSLHAGKMYLPFGNYGSFMVSDPYTLELGETVADSLLLELMQDLLSVKFGLFRGNVDDGSEHHINHWTAALSVTPMPELEVGVSYLNDLAESNAELVAVSDLYIDEVAAASVYLTWQTEQFGIVAEYLTALEDFNAEVVTAGDALSGQRPQAWSLEFAWMPAERWQLAARYEQADDFLNDPRRYGAAASFGLYDNVAIALEYLYTDFDEASAPEEQNLVGQLALAF